MRKELLLCPGQIDHVLIHDVVLVDPLHRQSHSGHRRLRSERIAIGLTKRVSWWNSMLNPIPHEVFPSSLSLECFHQSSAASTRRSSGQRSSRILCNTEAFRNQRKSIKKIRKSKSQKWKDNQRYRTCTVVDSRPEGRVWAFFPLVLEWETISLQISSIHHIRKSTIGGPWKGVKSCL